MSTQPDRTVKSDFEDVAEFMATLYCDTLMHYSIHNILPENDDNQIPSQGRLEPTALPPSSIEMHFERLYNMGENIIDSFNANTGSTFDGDFQRPSITPLFIPQEGTGQLASILVRVRILEVRITPS